MVEAIQEKIIWEKKGYQEPVLWRCLLVPDLFSVVTAAFTFDPPLPHPTPFTQNVEAKEGLASRKGKPESTTVWYSDKLCSVSGSNRSEQVPKRSQTRFLQYKICTRPSHTLNTVSSVRNYTKDQTLEPFWDNNYDGDICLQRQQCEYTFSP